MTKWEYLSATIDPNGGLALNVYGARGWELVAVVQTDIPYLVKVFFKRKVV